MTYRQRETMRELRLWIGQVIVPVIAVVATVAGVPEVRENIKECVNQIKTNVFQKHEGEP